VAILTDLLDGFLARSMDIASKEGGALDRKADKIFLGVLFLLFLLDGRIPPALKLVTVFIAIVELVLFYYYCKGLRRGFDVSTAKSKSGIRWGQWKMAAISLAILFCLLYLMISKPWSQKGHQYAVFFLVFAFSASLALAARSLLGNRAYYLQQLAQAENCSRNMAGLTVK